jgi:hypothetical protein
LVCEAGRAMEEVLKLDEEMRNAENGARRLLEEAALRKKADEEKKRAEEKKKAQDGAREAELAQAEERARRATEEARRVAEELLLSVRAADRAMEEAVRRAEAARRLEDCSSEASSSSTDDDHLAGEELRKATEMWIPGLSRSSGQDELARQAAAAELLARRVEEAGDDPDEDACSSSTEDDHLAREELRKATEVERNAREAEQQAEAELARVLRAAPCREPQKLLIVRSSERQVLPPKMRHRPRDARGRRRRHSLTTRG